MSDVITPVVPPVPAHHEPVWIKPLIALASMALLGAVIVYAAVMRDHDMMTLCVGAVIAMATGAVNYYLGSSSGSARKTEITAAAAPRV